MFVCEFDDDDDDAIVMVIFSRRIKMLSIYCIS